MPDQSNNKRWKQIITHGDDEIFTISEIQEDLQRGFQGRLGGSEINLKELSEQEIIDGLNSGFQGRCL